MSTKSILESVPENTNTIREVFRYINRFKGQVFVLKIEDDLLETPLFSLLIKDIVLIQKMGIKIILIPGTKNSINQVLTDYGEQTTTKDNIRITTDAALPLVKLGASNVANKLLTLLSENGAHGVLGNWVRARSIGVIKGLDYQNTGKVDYIKIPVIENLLDDNLIPILSNIGWSAVGKAYNISSNELAVSCAKAIGAAKLFFLGVRKGIPQIKSCKIQGLPVRDTGHYSTLDFQQGQKLLKLHRKSIPKDIAEIIRLALEACKYGVKRVHIIDGSDDGILLKEIFSTTGQGTMFHANIYANIRKAKTADIPELLHIMQPYVERGILVQRNASILAQQIDQFYVYEVDDAIHGCGAVTIHSKKMAELEAIMVDPQYARRNTGTKIVHYLLNKAQDAGCTHAFVLTTQSIDYFMKLGFEMASINLLPAHIKDEYNKKRNSKILAMDLRNFEESNR